MLVDESDRSKAKITPGASLFATDMITPFTSAYRDNNMIKIVEMMITIIRRIIIEMMIVMIEVINEKQ